MEWPWGSQTGKRPQCLDETTGYIHPAKRRHLEQIHSPSNYREDVFFNELPGPSQGLGRDDTSLLYIQSLAIYDSAGSVPLEHHDLNGFP